MKPELHERKWEIDSLCYPIRLAHGYWKTTGDTSCFDENWTKAMKMVVQTFRQQQRKESRGPYHFMRTTPISTDTVPGRGYGNPVKPVGLICSAFRPSDDATIYLFLVPSNYFAVRSLRQVAEISKNVLKTQELAAECIALAQEVETALKEYTYIDHLDYGVILPYEVDGFGNRLFMDDANVPSLLAMPYLDTIDQNAPIYQTDQKICTEYRQPIFFSGKSR